jgi:predicted DNA-binding transcriptional regulator AlpA
VKTYRGDLAFPDPGAVPVEEIPEIIGELERLKAHLWARLSCGDGRPAREPDDESLDVREAAKRLGMSPSWLYRNWRSLNLGGRTGSRSLRFSANAIRRYQANHRRA